MKKILSLLTMVVMAVLPLFAQTPVATFKVAALNVDGLPKKIATVEINPDGKEAEGATAIGQKLATMGYDVIAVSEDFDFNESLASPLAGVYESGTWRGKLNPNVMGILFKSWSADTDGLNLFWKNGIKVENETWAKWNAYNGYTDQGADGLIKKGFRYYMVTFAEGVVVDLYILHMDAETNPGDITARESQMEQLVAAIKATDNKRPVIVMGDTNCRYTRDKLKSNFVDVLNADPRFTVHDAWVDQNYEGEYPQYGGGALMTDALGFQKGEVVDKLLFINNSESAVQLKLKNFMSDTSFKDANGDPLADHFPVVGEFEVYNTSEVGEDKLDEDVAGKVYYLRNVATGKFLKSGGWWGTHAMQGDYGLPITLKEQADGKFLISTPINNPNAALSHYLTQNDPYMNGTAVKWVVNDLGGGRYSLTYLNGGTKALTAKDPTPGYVTCATYNSKDTYQQWEMLTREQMVEEMQRASLNNPVNVTWLLRGANFDQDDLEGKNSWNNSISPSASKMSYNLCDGRVDIEYGNPIAEVYVSSFSSGSYETRWEVGQTLTGVPNGRYKITMQGFYRVKDHNQDLTATSDVFLIGRSGETENKTRLCQVYETKVSESIMGEVTSEGYYVPNSMQDATLFFNAGYYQNEVVVDVLDGTLTVAVAKTATSKSSSVWTCFDNFQILYMEPTTTIPFEVKESNRWSTLILPFDAKIPAGLSVKTVEGAGENGVLTLTDVEQIEAKTPYVVYAENGIMTQFEGCMPEVMDASYDDNKNMIGVLAQEGLAPASGSYVLQNQSGVVGFYQIPEGWGRKVKQYHCYLHNSVATAKVLFFNDADAATALEQIAESPENGNPCVYDLGGRQVTEANKGVYIKNGKKVVH